MTASIPVSIPVFTTLQDDIDFVLAEHQNTPNDEITALATLLGMPGVSQGHLTSFLTLLHNFRFGCVPLWNSTSSIDISLGQIVISNAGGTVRKLRSKTTTTSLTAASDMDTGSAFSNSTDHYIYATADTGVTTPVYKISTNASAPSGMTHYRKVGGFRTDGSGNILQNSIYSVLEGADQRLPKGYIYGGMISNSTGDPTNDLDIAPCIARDDTDKYTLVLGTTFTKQIDSTFVAGSAAGGLDTGSIGASGVKVYVWLIGKSTDPGKCDVLFSKTSSPTMPSGWDIKRLLGCRYWNSTALLLFKSLGNANLRKTYMFTSIQVVSSGSPGSTFTDVDLSDYVADGYATEARLAGNLQGSTHCSIYARCNGSSEAIGTGNQVLGASSGSGSSRCGGEFYIGLDADSIFEYGTAGGSADIYLTGYTEVI